MATTRAAFYNAQAVDSDISKWTTTLESGPRVDFGEWTRSGHARSTILLVIRFPGIFPGIFVDLTKYCLHLMRGGAAADLK
jgi:hypothetical protein